MYEKMSKTTGILDICAPVATLHWYSFDKVWYLQWYGMVWFGICIGMVWYDMIQNVLTVWYGMTMVQNVLMFPPLCPYPLPTLHSNGDHGRGHDRGSNRATLQNRAILWGLLESTFFCDN